MQKGEGRRTSEMGMQQSAIKAGLKALISEPGLRNYAVLITNSLDNKKIFSFIEEAEKELKEKKVPYDEQNKLMYNGIANYVASGNALKDTAKQTLLEKSHEGKLDKNVLEKIVGFFKPNKFEGEKY